MSRKITIITMRAEKKQCRHNSVQGFHTVETTLLSSLILLITVAIRCKRVRSITTKMMIKALGEKPFPLPLCPLQILHRLAWARTQASTGTGWQPPTSAMAWPMTEKVKVLFYPMLCDFWEKYRFLKVSRLHQFTFLVKE
jgi:hypothetical protein